MIRKYKVLKDRDLSERMASAGDIVYDAKYYDYGCASDDYRATGVEHKSVTLDKDGEYPFFTIPLRDLEEVK